MTNISRAEKISPGRTPAEYLAGDPLAICKSPAYNSERISYEKCTGRFRG